MNGFTKLFSSIITSTIWQEDPETKVVWITLLALADAQGRVNGTIPGISNIANVSVKKTEKAIENFLNPDKYSRSQEYEGRRIAVIDGGWQLLNHKTYRNKGRKDAEYYRKYRLKKEKERAEAEAEAEEQPDATTRNHAQPVAEFTLPPDIQLWQDIAFTAGLTPEEARNSYDNFGANGWKRGNGQEIVSWSQVPHLLTCWRNNRQNFAPKKKTESAYDQVAQLKERGEL